MQERYGHLLDKYINAADYPNPILHRETSKYIKDVDKLVDEKSKEIMTV